MEAAGWIKKYVEELRRTVVVITVQHLCNVMSERCGGEHTSAAAEGRRHS